MYCLLVYIVCFPTDPFTSLFLTYLLLCVESDVIPQLNQSIFMPLPIPELSILCDPNQPNPVQVEKFGPNPTQPNTTNYGSYSLVGLVTCFIHRTYIVLLVNQASTYSCSLLIVL